MFELIPATLTMRWGLKLIWGAAFTYASLAHPAGARTLVGHFVDLVPTRFDDHRRAALTPNHNTPPPSPPTSSPRPPLQSPSLVILSVQTYYARHHSRDAVTRDPQRLGCASRAPLRSRSLRPPSEGNEETCSRCASGTERWQECTGLKQLRWYVGPCRMFAA
jgi:hypothetical protein